MSAPILASTIFGRSVTVDGASERLRDLGVVKAGESWRIAAVRTNLRDATFTAWSDGAISATASGDGVKATWLREALFDRQIVDLEGRRVIRVGDVVLRADGDALAVESVEVGAAAVLRRLGLEAPGGEVRSPAAPDPAPARSEGGCRRPSARHVARAARAARGRDRDWTALAAARAGRRARRADVAPPRRDRAPPQRPPCAPRLSADASMSRLRIAAFLAVLGPGSSPASRTTTRPASRPIRSSARTTATS